LQPFSSVGNPLVPPLAQLLPYRLQFAPQPLLDRLPFHRKPVALPGLPADMRETQKIEGLGFALTSLLPVALRESPKLDQPRFLRVTLRVQQEIQARLDEVDHLRKKQVERARYEADLAQRRYLHVDPTKRLVADSLEADWNNKLRALNAAQEQYEEQRKNDRAEISEQQRASIVALAHDFPQLWQNPKTPDRERKRLARLLLEDVTLIRNGEITAHVRFKGGITQTLTVPLPLNAWQLRLTSPDVVAEIDRLLDQNTYLQIASLLNDRGLRSGEGKNFTAQIVARIRRRSGLTSRYDRLRKAC